MKYRTSIGLFGRILVTTCLCLCAPLAQAAIHKSLPDEGVFQRAISSALLSDYVTARRLFTQAQQQDDASDLITLYIHLLDDRLRYPLPDTLMTDLFTAIAALESQQWDDAVDRLNQVIARQPRYAVAYVLRGIGSYHLGETQEAIADLSDAVFFGCTMEQVYLYRGLAYRDMGMARMAVADFDQVLRLMPDHRNARYQRARALSAMGESERALEDINALIKLAPTNPAYYHQRAIIYSNAAQDESALRDFRKALFLRPDYVQAYRDIATVFLRMGLFEEAASAISQSMVVEPEDVSAMKMIGELFFYNGQYMEAQRFFTDYLRKRPDDMYRMLWLYMATMNLGDSGLERLHTDFAASSNRDWPAPLVQFYLGDLSEDDLVKAALADDPVRQRERLCEVYFYLAHYYRFRDQEAVSLSHFNKALATRATWSIEYGYSQLEMQRENESSAQNY